MFFQLSLCSGYFLTISRCPDCAGVLYFLVSMYLIGFTVNVFFAGYSTTAQVPDRA